MPKDGRYDDLTAFLDARGDALLRTAVLLTPGREAGQDLLQEALERLLRKWHKVHGDPEGYLRRIMYNRAVDGWRSRARRPEVIGLPAHVAAVADHASQLDVRLALIAALGLLTPRQRAAVVARYWEQLSEAETAEALGCSVSAVKAAAARGLRTLREAISPDMEYATELSTEETGL
jgi:RNA polymerase sigma-70 factor (sigma-E family)